MLLKEKHYKTWSNKKGLFSEKILYLFLLKTLIYFAKYTLNIFSTADYNFKT